MAQSFNFNDYEQSLIAAIIEARKTEHSEAILIEVLKGAVTDRLLYTLKPEYVRQTVRQAMTYAQELIRKGTGIHEIK